VSADRSLLANPVSYLPFAIRNAVGECGLVSMKASITSAVVTELLTTLYADAAKNDPLARKAALEAGETEAEYYKAMRKAYVPVPQEFGNLLYGLVRSAKAKTVIEFGTSFGISTIFLAAAIRDNGTGKVVTTEFVAEKAEQARKNLAAVGLEDWVDVRIGDALETLKADLPHEIDLILLDGAKGLYFDVLRLLEPDLRSGAIVASDNTDHKSLGAFLSYLRNPENGYTSTAILTAKADVTRPHEISIRN
jgi:predicted O-methyltransferase YrrM